MGNGWGVRMFRAVEGLIISVVFASLAFGEETRSIAMLKPSADVADATRFALGIGNSSSQNVKLPAATRPSTLSKSIVAR